ncbi:MAG: recombination protein O N-terminal domain-containing protein [Candidatus Paceibacterota bacterium]
MKYNIYDTQALVLKNFAHREDSCSVLLFTREFGCLYAQAQGARKISSRLRSGLTESSYVTVGLLSGKGGWRVTYLLPHSNIFFSLGDRPEAKRVIAKIMSICAHLLGEGLEDRRTFDLVIEGFMRISNSEDNGQSIRETERVIMLNIMYLLGYIKHSSYARFMQVDEKEDEENFLNTAVSQREITNEINKALNAAW